MPDFPKFTLVVDDLGAIFGGASVDSTDYEGTRVKFLSNLRHGDTITIDGVGTYTVRPVYGTVDADGELTVQLLADDAVLNLENPLEWKISFSGAEIDGFDESITEWWFPAGTDGQTVNLSEVVRSAGNVASGAIRGPIGVNGVYRSADTLVFTNNSVDLPNPVDISDLLFSDGAHTFPTFTVNTFYGGTLGGSDDTTCTQNTIDACYDAGGGIVVMPPKGGSAWWKWSQLVMRAGVHFKGVGWHSFGEDGQFGGTMAQQLTGINDDLIVFENAGGPGVIGPCGISDFSLRGAAGASAGHAINMIAPDSTPLTVQDLTTFERIYGVGFAGSVIKATGGVPLVLSDITGLGNGRYVVEIEDGALTMQVLLKNITGDANMGGGAGDTGAVVLLKGITNGNAPSVSIFGVKSEYRIRATAWGGDGVALGNYHAVIIENCDCPITVTGVNHMGFHSTKRAGNAIEIIGAAVPDLMWQSVHVDTTGSTGTIPVSVYDEVNSRGTDARHGVWGPTPFALDALEVNGVQVVMPTAEVNVAPALYDSFTAADGTALDSGKWTVTTGGAAAAAVTTNGNRARFTAGATGGYAAADKAFAASTLATSLIDAEILARHTFGAVTIESYTFYTLRASVVDPTGGTGYALLLDNGNAYLNKYVSSVYTNLGTVPFTSIGLAAPSNGSMKWIRVRAKGTTIAFKVWDDGTAEPVSWTFSTTDSAIATGGKTVIAIHGGSAAASGVNYVDQVHIYAL